MDKDQLKQFKKNARCAVRVGQEVQRSTSTEADALEVLQAAVAMVLGSKYTIIKDKTE